MPTTCRFRGAGHGGFWQQYGTGKDGVLTNAGTVTLTAGPAKEYRHVDVGGLTHAAGITSQPVVRSLGALIVRGHVNLDGLGVAGGAAGAMHCAPAGNGNPGAAPSGASGTGWGNGGAGSKGADAGIYVGGAGGAGATPGAGGGGGGGAYSANQWCSGGGGTGGAAGGACGLHAPRIDAGNVTTRGVDGAAGAPAQGGNEAGGGSGGGGGGGGPLDLTARVLRAGVVSAASGAGGAGSGGLLPGVAGNPGAAGTLNVSVGNDFAASYGSTRTVGTARRPCACAGVGVFRPRFGSALVGGVWG